MQLLGYGRSGGRNGSVYVAQAPLLKPQHLGLADVWKESSESKRRELLRKLGIDVDEILHDYSERLQSPPLPPWEASVAMTLTLGWFAMPLLHRLAQHTKLETRQFAAQLIGKLEQLVEPPVLFESPCRSVEIHAGKIFNNIGSEKIKNGDCESALSYFEKAIVCDSGEPAYWVNKASALGGLGSYLEACAAMTQAIELDEQNPEWIARLGNYFGFAGKFHEATNCFEALVVAGYPNAQQLLDRAREGEARKQRGDSDS